jgi:hypothetical protein
VRDPGFFNFIELQLKRFERVFLIPGYTESYSLDPSEFKTAIVSFGTRNQEERSLQRQMTTSSVGEFIFLHCNRYDIDEQVTVLGCPLYAYAERDETLAIVEYLNSNEADVLPEGLPPLHLLHKGFLQRVIAKITCDEPRRQIVILTHCGPIRCLAQVQAPSQNNVRQSRIKGNGAIQVPLSSAFCTDLTEENVWMSPMVKVWAFGATGWNCNYQDIWTGREIVSNQRGFEDRGLVDGFDPGLVVEVRHQQITEESEPTSQRRRFLRRLTGCFCII